MNVYVLGQYVGVVWIMYVIACTTYKNSNYESFSKTQKRANKTQPEKWLLERKGNSGMEGS